VLYVLAMGPDADDASAVRAAGVVADVIAILREADPEDVAQHTHAVIQAVALLAKRGALPPAYRQRPPWLRPTWGRWRHAVAMQRALAEFARSPTTAEMAAATARARIGRSLALPGGPLGSLRPGGTGRRDRAASGAPLRPRALEGEDRTDEEWGAAPGAELPSGQKAGPLQADQGTREGLGHDGAFGGGVGGAGPGVLGALHVVDAAPSDRIAYWQLRGALAPEIEQLVERLRAASGQDEAAAPRRFQRAGRIDRNRFPAALTGREAVFVRFVHRPQPAHALCLLLDCSASMTTRADQLRQAAILVESATAAVGAHVSAFLFGPGWERMEPAGEGAPLIALGRDLHPHGGTPFGPAVAAAAEWLAHQPFRQKRLWVFSDGQWSARDRAVDVWRPELLKDVVVWIMAEEAPEPPHPAMRVVTAPTLDDLVRLAPKYFWPDREAGRLA
jgi:hypothetical protein